MTDTYKILGQTLTGEKALNNTDIKESTLYTTPSNTSAALSSVIVTNSSDNDQEYNLSVIKNGEDLNFVDSVYFNNATYTISSTGVIKYSEDGINWNTITINVGFSPLRMIATDKHIVVTGTKKISYSSDLKTWTNVSLSATPMHLAYGNNKVVMTANAEKSIVFDDSDGVIVSVNPAPFTADNIIFGDNKFVIVNYYGIAYSQDGITWTSRSVPTNNIYTITYGNGIFIAGGWVSQMRSTDGINWTKINSNLATTGYVYIDGYFYAYGYAIWRSQDGIQWTPVSNQFNETIYILKKSGGKFLAYGDGYRRTLHWSNDGITWNTVNTPSVVRDAAFVNETLFLVAGGYIQSQTEYGVQYSFDYGATWNYYENYRSFHATSSDMMFQKGFAFGFDGHLVTTDSQTWTYVNSPISGQYSPKNAIHHMVLQPWNGNIYVSSDGNTWSTVYINMTWINRDTFKYQNGVYSCVQDKKYSYSYDGYNWTTSYINFPNGDNLTDIVYDGNNFIAVGYTSVGISSNGGSSWTYSWISPETTQLAYVNKAFYMMSSDKTTKLSFENNQPNVTRKTFIPGGYPTATVGIEPNKIAMVGNHESSVYDTESNSVTRTGPINSFRKVVYGNNKYVTTDGSNGIYISDDGSTWTRRTTSFNLEYVAFGNEMFVFTSGNYIVYSQNLIDFSYITASGYYTLNVLFDGVKFIISGYNMTGYSQNGIDWTFSYAPYNIYKLYYDNNIYIASNGSDHGRSYDGITFEYNTLPQQNTNAIAYGNGVWVAPQWYGARVSYNNFESWIPVAESLYFGGAEAFFLNGKFYSIGYGGILSSSDGVTWKIQYSSGNYSAAVSKANGKIFIALSKSMVVTEDMINFLERVPVQSNESIAYKNNKIIASGYTFSGTNVIIESENGLDWNIVSSGFLTRGIKNGYMPLIEMLPVSLNKQTIVYRKQIGAGQVHEIQGGITLSSGDKIRVYSDSNEIIANAYGVEIQ